MDICTDNRGTCIPLNDPHYYAINNACYMQCCLFEDLLVMVALAFLQIIFHSKNFSTMEHIAFLCFPETYNLSSFQSNNNKLDLISLSTSLSPISKFFLCWRIVISPKAFPHHYKLKKISCLHFLSRVLAKKESHVLWTQSSKFLLLDCKCQCNYLRL